VTQVVIVIVGMMALRDQRENRGMDKKMGIITIMTMGREMRKVGRGKGGRGVRMHTRRCLSIRVGVQRIKDRTLCMSQERVAMFDIFV
jgi:hypothetical protein